MKILIVNLGARGDVLRTSGLIGPLQKKYPDSGIWWLVSRDSSELLKNCNLEDILVFDSKERSEIAKRIDELEFDLIINLEESLEIAGLFSGSTKKIVGFFEKNGKVMPTVTAEEYWKMGLLGPHPENDELKKNNKKTYQKLLQEMLQLDTELKKPCYLISSEAEKKAESFFQENGINNKERVIGINFGSGERWVTKRFQLSMMVDFANRIQEELKIKTVFIAGEDETAELEKNKKKTRGLAIAFSQKTEVLAGIINRCDFIITTDTFVMHLAAAVGTESLAFFGSTSAREIEGFGLIEKYVADYDCVCCYKKVCDKDPTCMESFDLYNIVMRKLKKNIEITEDK